MSQNQIPVADLDAADEVEQAFQRRLEIERQRRNFKFQENSRCSRNIQT